MKIFNYKDWWGWVYYIVLIYCVVGLIYTSSTWVRWKWGYYSLDALPYYLILFCLGIMNQIILNHRILQRIKLMEDRLKEIEG